MAAPPTISRLATALSVGLPPAHATLLAQSTGLHRTSIDRLIALWLAGHEDAAYALATRRRRAGRVGVVAPGNLFIATWQLMVEALSLGGAVRVRASGRDRESVRVLCDLLAAIRSPWLDAIEVCHFERDDDAAWAGFTAGLDALVAQGSDAAMASLGLRLRRLRPSLPLRRHGHRLSWMWARRDGGEAAALLAADEIAHDTLLADGRGCMAPRALLIDGAVVDMKRVTTTLRGALRAQAAALPRGQLPEELAASQRAWIEQARFDAALSGASFHAQLDADFGLVVVGGPPPIALQARDLGPGGRLLVVRAAPQQLKGLAATAAQTSTVAMCRGDSESVAGDGDLRDDAERALLALGVRRVCAPGRMQAPPWSKTSDGGELGEVISAPTSGSSSA